MIIPWHTGESIQSLVAQQQDEAKNSLGVDVQNAVDHDLHVTLQVRMKKTLAKFVRKGTHTHTHTRKHLRKYFRVDIQAVNMDVGLAKELVSEIVTNMQTNKYFAQDGARALQKAVCTVSVKNMRI